MSTPGSQYELAHVLSLRRWVNSMQHLDVRTDDEFLLRFLRTAKYDQSQAQLLLDNFCTIRSSPRGSSDWFDYPSLDSPTVQEYLTHPFQVNLGYTQNNEVLLLASLQHWDVKKLPFLDFIKCNYMAMDLVVMDENIQKHGVKVIIDLANTNRSHFMHMENPKNFFTLFRNWQEAFPMKIKSVIHVNEPAIFDILFRLLKGTHLIKEKVRSRLHKVGSDYSKLRALIGEGAEDVLPQELGGRNHSLEQLMDEKRSLWKSDKSLNEWRLLRSIKVDESKRLSNTKDNLKMFDSPNMGTSGTFTKTNFD